MTHTPVRLGSYQLLRPLAHGGMADVYLARRGEDHVAVKILDSKRSEEPETCALFLHEGNLVKLLAHANIAAVYDAAIEDGFHYIAMEYIHGADLRELVNTATFIGQAIPHATAVSIVRAAGAGLDHAHRASGPDGVPLDLVHRDVSLSNIMVGHDGEVKLVDFGIASTALSTVETAPGIVRGKASYMAPEQCLGEPIDRRTDVFALGIVLYELTTGMRCFHGDSDFDRMLAIVRGEIVAPCDVLADYPPELEEVVLTALATAKDARYPSVAAMLAALERVAEAYRWQLGASPVRCLMRAVYGEVGTPWELADEVTLNEVVPVEPDVIIPIEPISVDIMIEECEFETASSKRRLARGAGTNVSDWTFDEHARRRVGVRHNFTTSLLPRRGSSEVVKLCLTPSP